jgi:hypothetical protein
LISMTSRVRVSSCHANRSIEPCSRPTENVTSACSSHRYARS